MHCVQYGINIAVEDHYCFECGARKLVNYDLGDENDFIEYYFKRSFMYESILVQLDIHHKIKMSLRTLLLLLSLLLLLLLLLVVVVVVVVVVLVLLINFI